MYFYHSCRRVQCVAWVVGPQYKFYVRITRRQAIAGVCLLCIVCMYVLLELATYQTIVDLSAKLTKATTKVHTGCYLHILSTFHFYWGFALNQKSMWNKWKYHFSEMKRDVGMSHRKKEVEQENA